jgi:hypothetical protein
MALRGRPPPVPDLPPAPPARRPFDLADGLGAAGIGLVGVAVVLHRVALGEAPWADDLAAYHYPLQALFRLPAGPPEWNPYIFTGMPFLADFQTAAWHPWTMLFRWLDPWWAAVIILTLNFVTATTGGAWMASSWVDRRSCRWLAGAVYAFGGFLVVHHIHLGVHIGAATLPWVVGATVRGLDADRIRPRMAWMGLAGLGLGSGILSGHLQMPLYCGMAMGLLAVSWPVRGGSIGRHLADRALLVGGALAIAALTAAAALVPFVLWLPHTPRSAAASVGYAIAWGIGPRGWSMLLVPDFWGRGAAYEGRLNYWEQTTYVGLLPLVLAGVAAPLAWRIPRLRPLLLLGATGALITAGKWGGIQILLGLLPGYGMFRNSNRAWVLATLAVAVLAAVGLEALAGREARTGRSAPVARYVALLAALALALGAGAVVAMGPRWPIRPDALLRAAVLATLVALWLAYARRGLPRRVIAAAALLIAIDLGAQWATYIATATPERIRGVSAVLAPVDNLPSSHRILSVLGPDAGSHAGGSIHVNWVAPLGVRSIYGYNPLLSRHVLEALAAADTRSAPNRSEWPLVTQASHPWYRSLGLRYVIAEAGTPNPDDAEPVWRSPDHTVWELRAPRHRAFVTAAAPAHITHTPLHALSAVPEAEVRFDRDDPDEVVLSVRADAPATVVLTDAWAPGWSVAVDGGSPRPAALAAQAFRAVDIPAGRHTVRWRFSTPGRRLGEALSIVGLVLGVGAITLGGLGRGHARDRSAV